MLEHALAVDRTARARDRADDRILEMPTRAAEVAFDEEMGLVARCLAPLRLGRRPAASGWQRPRLGRREEGEAGPLLETTIERLLAELGVGGPRGLLRAWIGRLLLQTPIAGLHVRESGDGHSQRGAEDGGLRANLVPSALRRPLCRAARDDDDGERGGVAPRVSAKATIVETSETPFIDEPFPREAHVAQQCNLGADRGRSQLGDFRALECLGVCATTRSARAPAQVYLTTLPFAWRSRLGFNGASRRPEARRASTCILHAKAHVGGGARLVVHRQQSSGRDRVES